MYSQITEAEKFIVSFKGKESLVITPPVWLFP